MTWSNIHDDAELDGDGIPRHPDDDRDHAICAYPKSDRASPPEHGRDRDDVAYCTLAAGWGRGEGISKGHCTKHGATKSDLSGWDNPNAKHGLYMDLEKSSLSDDEIAMLGDLDGVDSKEQLEQLINLMGVRFRKAYDAIEAGRVKADPHSGELRLEGAEGQLFQFSGRLASLIETYHRITEGQQINVDKKTEITGDASISVEWQVSRAELEDPDVDVELADGETVEIEDAD